MRIRPVDPVDVEMWAAESDVAAATPITFVAPPGMEETVAPAECVALKLADGSAAVAVAWQPNEIDVARLAQGGTVWLQTVGGLPPHRIEVR